MEYIDFIIPKRTSNIVMNAQFYLNGEEGLLGRCVNVAAKAQVDHNFPQTR